MINCFFEDSNQPVKLRHAVIDILIIENHKILLVKRAKVLTSPGKWALPGGFVERDETLKQAALREGLEESGYQVKILSLFRVIDNPNRRQEPNQNVAFEFLAKPIQKIQSHDSEISQVKWFDLNNLPKASEIAFDHLETIKQYIYSLGLGGRR